MTPTELEDLLGRGAYDDLCMGIACEAKHDANVWADELSRLSPAAKPNKRRGEALDPQLNSVLALLAMLPRIQHWHDDQCTQHFTRRPPEPAVVLEALKRFLDSQDDVASLALCRRLAVDALLCWMENCSWSARRTIGVEVVFGRPSEIMAHAEDMTHYLHRHYHIVTDEKGGNHADS
ncbi:MAG: hypothetical protein GY842_19785 [bacterium]|nr:hypothetical protein [bacterium]